MNYKLYKKTSAKLFTYIAYWLKHMAEGDFHGYTNIFNSYIIYAIFFFKMFHVETIVRDL